MATILAIDVPGPVVADRRRPDHPARDETVISLLAHAVFGDGAALLPGPGLGGADPGPGREYGVCRLPAPGVAAGARRLRPKQLAFRGERLAFSNGILMLGGLSALLIVLFGGSTGALLPLYAVAVFTAFTLSQAGMVAALAARSKGRRWQLKAVINGIGATATGLVALIAAIDRTSWTRRCRSSRACRSAGARGWCWSSCPLFIWLFLTIKAPLRRGRAQTRPCRRRPTRSTEQPLQNVVVVPIARLTGRRSRRCATPRRCRTT